eukprot:gb/GEZN01008837.1/.p1 GENE.gb/GEZN01008837.1/~~gb/GEZN01008837.1/.p1  ORF type:complete len:415 (+),score=51.44 gb/GEZN01008837.1/:35-1279(+)
MLLARAERKLFVGLDPFLVPVGFSLGAQNRRALGNISGPPAAHRSIPCVSSNLAQGRLFSSLRSATFSEASYAAHGDPKEVLKISRRQVSSADLSLPRRHVLVGMLAAPINPADINMIEGVYNILPPLPAVGGNEGVGEVLQVGEDVTKMKVGDRVIPARPGYGTWRSHGIAQEDELDVISADLPIPVAATIAVNPCTAYRMLHDFASLKDGDVVIQNGANSGVGIATIQIAKALGFRSINVVRQRPNFEQLRQTLESMGADLVMTAEELADNVAYKNALEKAGLEGVPPPRLGFNCIGGTAAGNLAKRLANKGTLVTYGGMSKRPLTISAAKLIFGDISLRGFWLSRWVTEHSASERRTMIDTLGDMALKGHLKECVENFNFPDQMTVALERAQSPFREGKVLLLMKPDQLSG